MCGPPTCWSTAADPVRRRARSRRAQDRSSPTVCKPLTGMQRRSVIITGGSRGLGAALVRTFLELGDSVATCSRSPTADTDAWRSEADVRDRFHYEAFDLADRTSFDGFVQRVIDRFGRIDVLVNNAAIAHEGVLGLV